VKNREFRSDHERGRDVSQELTEVRTVLSRAESAKAKIESYRANPRITGVSEDDHRYGGNEGFDPDGAEMIQDLDRVICFLDKWRKTGTTKRRV
jgi:hypothetical protein